VQLFTYAVPSQGNAPYLSALGSYPSNAAPLLSSHSVRIDIDGSYVGTGKIEAVNAGQVMALPLGKDKAITITSESILPSHKGMEEDTSTWFVSVDKKKYRIRTEERLIHVHNGHTGTGADVLVLLAENLPRSSEEDFRVELLSPSRAELQTLPSGWEKMTDKEFMLAVLRHEFATHQSSTIGVKKAAYLCASSGNLYWAIWMGARQTAALSFKFKVTSPEQREVTIN
jgi:hypothetical protein